MKYLGIDYGAKRVGVALSDDSGKIAFPHSTLSNDGTLLGEVKRICHEYLVEEIVIGESLNFHNMPNKLMKAIHRFEKKMSKELHLPVHLSPEHFSSAEAARVHGKDDELIDASAAAIILQSFLDRLSTGSMSR